MPPAGGASRQSVSITGFRNSRARPYRTARRTERGSRPRSRSSCRSSPSWARRRKSHAERADRDDRAFDHHHAPGDSLVGRRGQAPWALGVLVDAVERRPRPDEDVADDRRRDADGDDVAHLRAGAEPLRPGQHLDHGRPHQRPGREERDVLERVHGLVAERGLPEGRHVPEVEVDRPERERDEGMRQEAERAHRAQREERPEDRSGEPRDDAERCEVAEQQVLHHVERERLLLAERRDRRDERDDEEADAEREEEVAPLGDRRALARKRPGPLPVERRSDRDRDELERLERPRGLGGMSEEHSSSVGLRYAK